MATPNFPQVTGTNGNDQLRAPASTGAYDYAGLLGDDTIAAAAGSDLIYGDNRDGSGTGNDLISGGGGNDTIYGGYGRDEIYGDDGNDLIYGDSNIPDVVLAQYSADYIDGGNGDDTIHGQYGNDTIFGGEGKDEIYGEGDDDYIDGGAGNDSIDGGVGNDTLIGGEGNDTIRGGDGADTISGGLDNDLIYGDDGNDLIYGDEGNDVLYGGNGNDTLLGGLGDDSVYGGTGNDVLVGSAGNDLLDGGDGSDIVTYEFSTAGITLNLLDTTMNSGDAAGDTYVNIEAFMGSNYNDYLRAGGDGAVLYGLNGNDSMYGNIGNDYLNGGAGNDFMQGGPGDDTLIGGEGNDVYAFTSGEGITRVVELAGQGSDYLLVGANISELSLGKAGNNLVFFANNGADVAIFDSWFLNQAVEAIYLQSTGNFYDVAALVDAYIPSDTNEVNAASYFVGNTTPDFTQSVNIDFSAFSSIDLVGIDPADIPVIA